MNWSEEGRESLRNAEDNVRGEEGCWDGDPAKRVVELEGEDEDVDPGNLTNGNAVRDGQRGVENAVGTCQDVVHSGEEVERLGLIDWQLEGLVVKDGLDVGRQVVQDLQRQVSKRSLGFLDQLPRIRLSHWDAQEFSCSLEGVLLLLLI